MADEAARIKSELDSIVAHTESIRQIVDASIITPRPEPDKNIIRVRVGESVQQAYNTLLPTGGTILMAPGIHAGELKLVERPEDAKIINFMSDSENLPALDVRVTPEYLPAMAQIQSVTKTTSPIAIKNKSRNTAFVNIAVGPAFTKSYAQIYLGGDKTGMVTPADRPTDFLFDRCFLFGDPALGSHAGFITNALNVKIVGCYVQDAFEFGRDSQAIGAANGAQNILIDNCYLEGGAENVMFGGSDSVSDEMTPQDIVVRNCHLKKNFAWAQLPNPAVTGSFGPSIKCLFEIKNVKRLLLENTLLECNWSRDWSTGVALMLKACNQASAPWSVCEDVTLRNLLIRNVGSVFGIIGKNDGGKTSEWMKRIKIENILAHTIETGNWQGTGRGCEIANGAEEYFTIDHATYQTNTHSWMNFRTDSGITKSPGKLGMTNSAVAESSYGYLSAANGIGFAAAEKDWTGTLIEGNAFRAGSRAQGTVPANNIRIPGTAWDASFNANHEIIQGSEITKVTTTDGKLPGADTELLKSLFGPIL